MTENFRVAIVIYILYICIYVSYMLLTYCTAITRLCGSDNRSIIKHLSFYTLNGENSSAGRSRIFYFINHKQYCHTRGLQNVPAMRSLIRGRMALLWRGSYFLDLLSDHYGIVASNFLRAHFPVVKRTVVFITVPMHRAKQTSTTAFKTCKKNFGIYQLH